jgi:ubiquinone biosynthesis protein Coq4
MAYGTNADSQLDFATDRINKLLEQKSLTKIVFRLTDYTKENAELRALTSNLKADEEVKQQLERDYKASFEVLE